MSVAEIVSNGFHAAADYLNGAPSGDSKRHDARAEHKSRIEALETERLTLEENRLERRQHEARRAAADQRHAEVCGQLQEQLKTTSDPAARAKIREKISSENILLDATCRECDAACRPLDSMQDQMRRGRLGAEITHLRAELAKRPLANPELFVRRQVASSRVEWARKRRDAAGVWVEKVQRSIDGILSDYERGKDPAGWRRMMVAGNSPKPDVSAIEQQLSDARAECDAAQAELSAAQAEANELHAAMLAE